MPATRPRTEHAAPTPVGARLRAARLDLGLSMRGAVDGVDGISAATLCRVENGERSLSGPVLLTLGDRLGIARDELADLSGGLTGEGLGDILGSDVALCLRAGRLVPDAIQALRAVHLSQLARRRAGAALDDLSFSLDLDFRGAEGEPGFEADTAYYRIPLASPADTHRMWQAHGLAHAILADASGTPRACAAAQVTLPMERDVTILARHLLLPTAALRSAHRALRAPEPHDPRELVSLIAELAIRLEAPAGWIAARLTEEGLLGTAA
jgi:transcriptional regulator with XRE-family HTH domain